MIIKYSSEFLKHFKRRIAPNSKLKKQFYERIHLFKENFDDPKLKDHKLSGEKRGFRAFSISGDIRVIYRIHDEEVYLLDIGTHNQVYK